MTAPLHFTIWVAVDTDGNDLATTYFPEGPAECREAAREHLVEAAPDIVESGADEAAWVEGVLARAAIIPVRLEAETIEQLAAAIVCQTGGASVAQVREWAHQLPQLLADRDAKAAAALDIKMECRGARELAETFETILDRMERAQVLADTFLSYRRLGQEHQRWGRPVSAEVCQTPMDTAARQLRELAAEAGGPLLISLGHGVQLRVVPDLDEDTLDALSDGGEDDDDVDTVDLPPCGVCAGRRAAVGVDPWDGPCPHSRLGTDPDDEPDMPDPASFSSPSREW